MTRFQNKFNINLLFLKQILTVFIPWTLTIISYLGCYFRKNVIIFTQKFNIWNEIYENFFSFHRTKKTPPPFKLNFIVKCTLIWKMRNSFSLPNTHIYMYIHFMYVKLWTVASHFVNACHVLMWKKIKVSFHIPNTNYSTNFLKCGGGCNRNSKTRMTTTHR